MLLIKNFLMRWIHWPVLLSVCLHISIAVALFGSIKSGEPPEAPPMSVAMIQLAAEESSVEEPAMPESISEPEPEPEPIAKIALPKPKPEKKPEEKKVVKKESKPKEIKTEKTSEEPLLAKNLNDQKPTDSAIRDTSNAQKGPKALSRTDPVYPSRAQQLGTEGTVRVKYDIDENGRVKNIEIISANPKNVFEREVKKAMRKWRYEKKPATGYVTTIEFRLSGVSLS
ncbi:TonB system transport protein TonB [Xenorhabdus sp. SGI246]|uniref:TonB system transport protein TonB n=1 Tax=Xenorhabdus sp. SGI246 TaxID=3158263 RepID=UPI00349FCFE6